MSKILTAQQKCLHMTSDESPIRCASHSQKNRTKLLSTKPQYYVSLSSLYGVKKSDVRQNAGMRLKRILVIVQKIEIKTRPTMQHNDATF